MQDKASFESRCRDSESGFCRPCWLTPPDHFVNPATLLLHALACIIDVAPPFDVNDGRKLSLTKIMSRQLSENEGNDL